MNKETEEYKKAVWDFLMEHCDILPSGTMFIKFHTKGYEDTQRRIRARLKYNYHREDVESKKKNQAELKNNFIQTKQQKKLAYLKEKKERRKLMKRQFRILKIQNFFKNLLGWFR